MKELRTVFYIAQEEYNHSLATCIECGELFMIDWENPKTRGFNLKGIAKNQNCPKCGANLGFTLEEYSDTFLAANRVLASFNPLPLIPPANESKDIEEVWEIHPV